MIVAVLGETGGAGKTIFAAALAGMRAAAGHDVPILDAGRQGSASCRAEARGKQEVPTAAEHRPPDPRAVEEMTARRRPAFEEG